MSTRSPGEQLAALACGVSGDQRLSGAVQTRDISPIQLYQRPREAVAGITRGPPRAANPGREKSRIPQGNPKKGRGASFYWLSTALPRHNNYTS
jgi:hypothetical protein